MSKIFDGTYTRLDDDVSFQLIRTNPMLTTNTKLMYDGKNIYLESYNANPLLETQKYKNVKVKGTSPFNMDIHKFLLGAKSSAYDVFQKESDLSICDSYDKQFETMYWCGSEAIKSKQYEQELGFIAPLYIRKKLPNYFVIFKIDGPSNFNLNIGNDGEKIDDIFSLNEDIFRKAKIIKSFDLREGTPIGNYIKRYVEQSGFEYDKSIYVNFSTSEITYYGIDKKYGVLTSKTESFRQELLENDNTIMHSDDWITSGFKRNNLVFPYIINFEFLFDDNDTEEYKFSRYFGIYCNDIDLYEFEAKYNKSGIVVDKPEDLIKKLVVNYEVKLNFDNTEDLRNYNMDNGDKLSFHYIKDKNNEIHQVSSIDETNGKRSVSITDKTFDLSTVCGFENIGVSAYCERIKTVEKSQFSFTVKKKFSQGEQIKLIYDNELYKVFTAVDEDECSLLSSSSDESDSSYCEPIGPGQFRGSKFSALGTINDMVMALCNCINSSRDENHFFDAFYKDNVVVVRCLHSGDGFRPKLDVEFDKSLVRYGKVKVHGKTNDGGSVNYLKGSTFKIKSDDLNFFSNGRHLRTGNPEKKNAKILMSFPYVNENDIVEPDYFEIITDENGKYVNVSNTNMVEIVDRFYPKFGILSFFPVMDFDFDFVFSKYGYFKQFKTECETLENTSRKKSTDGDYKKGLISKLTKLADGYLKDYNGNAIDTEYEYFMENLIPELSTESKVVPYIAKWGYYDDEKDSCENPYRLNMSKIFGTSNLSSNTFTNQYSINEYTHSMPYYLTSSEKTTENNTEYQYVSDKIKIYDGDSIDSYDVFVEHCIDLFMDTDVDNFDKLLSYKTKYNKRFPKRYSRMKFGDNDHFASTLFRGVKFNIKKIIDGKERKGIDYNDYKFSFLYIPHQLESPHIDNKVYFVKNDTFKFIIGFVVVNTLSNIGINNQTYKKDDFCKAYMYGGCYGLLEPPSHKGSGDSDSDSESDSDGGYGNLTIEGIPFYSIFGEYKLDDGGYRMKNGEMVITNEFIKKIIKNVYERDCIESIRIYNSDEGSIDYTFVNDYYDNAYYDSEQSDSDFDVDYGLNVETFETKIKIKYFPQEGIYYDKERGMFVDITFKDKYEFEKLFKDYFDVFEIFSTKHIKDNINGGFNNINNGVVYKSTNADEYKIEIEDPVSFNTYDIFTSSPQVVPESGLSIPCCSDIALKANVNDIALKTINRYSGYYNPIFNEIFMFDDFNFSVECEIDENSESDSEIGDFYNHDSDSDGDDGNKSTKIYKYSNTRFDIEYKDNYGEFGVIKNIWFHKVNESNPEKIIRMANPLYPAIGEFSLDYRDYNVFESNWDKNYFTTQVDKKTYERFPGTICTKNNLSMFGSKYLNVPEEIRIECFNGCCDWNDEFITHPDSTKEEIMCKEINGNNVNFYLFLKKRIVRYFAEESGLKRVFGVYINPEYSYGNKKTIDDDVVSYIEKNIIELYYLYSIDMWVKETKSGLHDKKIENDYSKFLMFDDNMKAKKNMRKANKFSIKKMTEDTFDRMISYNLKTGYKEDFGFSITIKKI